jgi:hypothetical protein
VGIEIFERAAEGGGRVLRVELMIDASEDDIDPARGPGYLLTFDVGRVLVAANPAEGSLLVRSVEAASEINVQLVNLNEEEPWWRVIGNSITRVWPVVRGSGAAGGDEALSEVRLQFREDQDNPKVIALGFDRGAVRVREEKPSG